MDHPDSTVYTITARIAVPRATDPYGVAQIGKITGSEPASPDHAHCVPGGRGMQENEEPEKKKSQPTVELQAGFSRSVV
jgi:hypothetical protein